MRKNSFHEEWEQVIDQYPEHHRKIIFAGFNAKLEKIDISKPTNGNNSLHEPSNIQVVKVTNFAAAKDIIVKCTMFTFCNIHTQTWTPPDVKSHCAIVCFHQIGVDIHVHLMVDFSEQLTTYCSPSSDWKHEGETVNKHAWKVEIW